MKNQHLASQLINKQRANEQRGQMLTEFLLCLSIAVLLWIILVKVDGGQNIHNKIGEAIESDRARLEVAYPALNLSNFANRP